MKANDLQYGGDHYMRHHIQHWDMVYECGLDYYVACATKYIGRFRDKNGMQDLNKAQHYMFKRQELGITVNPFSKVMVSSVSILTKWVDTVCGEDRLHQQAIYCAVLGSYDETQKTIELLKMKYFPKEYEQEQEQRRATGEPTSRYTNQD